MKLNYTYGGAANNGNVLSQTITVPGMAHPLIQNYTYDSLNRLSIAAETSNNAPTWKQSFKYDRFGNRNFDRPNTAMPASFANPAITDPAINPNTNRITSTGFLFDAAGNTTRDGAYQTFTYDAENKQIEVRNSSSAILGQYAYDGDGKRVKKYVPGTGETTIFVYDAAGTLVAEYSTIVQSGANAKVSYLTNDHLGSPRINTDQNGAVISRHDYHPFGEEIDGTGGRTTGLNYGDDTVRQQFTGYERDGETGLDFAQARQYNAAHGRFTNPDPYNIILESQAVQNADKSRNKLNSYLGTPQQWNRYVYVSNNPMIYIDPSGEILELTGTQEERDRAFKRLQELVGKDAGLGLHTVGGRTFVIYNNVDNLRKSAGDVGQVVADIISSKTTVEFMITNQREVTNANGQKINLADRLAVTELVGKDRVQIFIKSGSADTLAFKMRTEWDAEGSWNRLQVTDSVMDAHELGHAWGAIKDNTYDRLTRSGAKHSSGDPRRENNNRALQVENWQRSRLGLSHRRSHP